jgi:chromate transporter
MPDAAPASAAPASPAALFKAFTRLAMQGFGGVLPVAQRELVERLGWLTREQFLELLSLSQVLPGPNVVNLALIYGDRCFGWRGALAACTGMLALPLLVVVLLTMAALRFADVPAVGGALRGMGVVAGGLVLATAIKLAPGLRANPLGRAPAMAFVAATVWMIAWLRWPLPWVVLALGLPGIALAAWRIGKALGKAHGDVT